MKIVFICFLFLASLVGCNKVPKIYDLEEFCVYTIDCYKNDNKKVAIGLRITKSEAIKLLNSMQLNTELRKQRLAAVEKQDTDGYFSDVKLEKLYADFRAVEDKDFWDHFSIEGYEYMETDNWFGYEMAEPIVVLKHGDYTTRFKIGELIKTDNGWRIIQGPVWK
jgi:hypothetical protein